VPDSSVGRPRHLHTARRRASTPALDSCCQVKKDNRASLSALVCTASGGARVQVSVERAATRETILRKRLCGMSTGLLGICLALVCGARRPQTWDLQASQLSRHAVPSWTPHDEQTCHAQRHGFNEAEAKTSHNYYLIEPSSGNVSFSPRLFVPSGSCTGNHGSRGRRGHLQPHGTVSPPAKLSSGSAWSHHRTHGVTCNASVGHSKKIGAARQSQPRPSPQTTVGSNSGQARLSVSMSDALELGSK
jgi:hypothetical protein